MVDIRKIVLKFVDPFTINIFVPSPPILETRARSKRIWRSVEILTFVEWWVGSNQVNRPGVNAPKDR